MFFVGILYDQILQDLDSFMKGNSTGENLPHSIHGPGIRTIYLKIFRIPKETDSIDNHGILLYFDFV